MNEINKPFTLEYSGGWYIAQNGLAVIEFPNGVSEAGFAQWVVEVLNTAREYAEAARQRAESEMAT